VGKPSTSGFPIKDFGNDKEGYLPGDKNGIATPREKVRIGQLEGGVLIPYPIEREEGITAICV